MQVCQREAASLSCATTALREGLPVPVVQVAVHCGDSMHALDLGHADLRAGPADSRGQRGRRCGGPLLERGQEGASLPDTRGAGAVACVREHHFAPGEVEKSLNGRAG